MNVFYECMKIKWYEIEEGSILKDELMDPAWKGKTFLCVFYPQQFNMVDNCDRMCEAETLASVFKSMQWFECPIPIRIWWEFQIPFYILPYWYPKQDCIQNKNLFVTLVFTLPHLF